MSDFGKGSSKAEGAININPDAWPPALGKLRGLNAPRLDRAKVAKLWDEYDAFTRWLAALEHDDFRKIIKEEPAIFRTAMTDAQAYGIEQCGTIGLRRP